MEMKKTPLVNDGKGFCSRKWELRYSTSSDVKGQKTLSMTDDFYVPLLEQAVHYDRVAGYFTSTSLSVAAEGFSSFVAKNGKIRMVVGEAVDPKDAEAILKGEQAVLDEALRTSLGTIDTLSFESCHRLHALCWLIAQGHLQMKVGIRVHAVTGRPLDWESQADGYVHEKWGYLEDAYGHRMAFSGSLNESRTALSLNAENVDVYGDWRGEDPAERIDGFASSFENLWSGECPSIRVFPISEAIKNDLIDLVEPLAKRMKDLKKPENELRAGQETEQEKHTRELKQFRLALLKDAPFMDGGLYVGMETSPVDPWPHQREVARRLVDGFPMGAMLCDEVGLGKTIEAGLAIRSLLLAGRVKKVLILAPASLCTQWQREMAEKFNLPFALILGAGKKKYKANLLWPEVKEEDISDSILGHDLTILSTALFRREDHFKKMMEEINSKDAKPDLVLIDEAHLARCTRRGGGDPEKSFPDEKSQFKCMKALAERMDHKGMWLATATPMQMSWIEAWDMMRLLQGTGWFDADPSLMRDYYSSLVNYSNRESSTWENRLLAISKDGLEDLERIPRNERIAARETDCIIQNKRVTIGTGTRGKLLKEFRRCAPLSRVMIRHTRDLLRLYKEKGALKAGLAERKIISPHEAPWLPEGQQGTPEALTLSQNAILVEKALSEYCEELGVHLPLDSRLSVRFYNSLLRVRLASCPQSLKLTLERRLKKVMLVLKKQQQLELNEEEIASYEAWIGGSSFEDRFNPDEDSDDFADLDEIELDHQLSNWLTDRSPEDLEWEKKQLEHLIRMLDIEMTSPESRLPGKLKELLWQLEHRKRSDNINRVDQTVVFTRFADTLNMLIGVLQERMPYLHLGIYSGGRCAYTTGMTSWKEAERDEVKREFISGNIDVLLCTDAAAEGLNLQTANLLINYDLPWNPMKLEQRIGRIDRIGQKYDKIYVLNLYYVDSVEEKIYDRLMKRLIEAGVVVGIQGGSILPITPEEFEQLADGTVTLDELKARIEERLQAARTWNEALSPQTEELYDLYRKHEEEWSNEPLPCALEDLWNAVTQLLSEEDSIWKLDGNRLIRTSDDGTKEILTSDRFFYDKGEANAKVHFVSFNDPVFRKAIELESVGAQKSPLWLKRLTADTGNGTDLVGYAAASEDGTVRLISSLKDSWNFIPCYKKELTDKDITAAQIELDNVALSVRQRYEMSTERMKTVRAQAKAQNALCLYVAKALLNQYTFIVKDGKGDTFSAFLRWVEERMLGRDEKDAQGLFLKNISWPEVVSHIGGSVSTTVEGSNGMFQAPFFVVDSAVALLNRLQNRASRKKKEQTVLSAEALLDAEARRVVEHI